MSKQDFTTKLEQALKQTARNIPEQVDFWPNLHRQLLAAQLQGAPLVSNRFFQRSSLLRNRKALSMVSALAAVVVIASAFAFAAGSTIFQKLGDPALKSAVGGHTTQIQQGITVKGITLHLDEVYVDAARTSVTFHVTSARSTNSAMITQDSVTGATIIDQRGHVYTMVSALGGGTPTESNTLIDFFPLSADQLNHASTLTFSVASMMEISFPKQPNVGKPSATSSFTPPRISGPWNIIFHIVPTPDRTLALSSAAQTYNGVSIQPTRIEVAPSGTRLLLHLSNLPADTSLAALNSFQIQRDHTEADTNFAALRLQEPGGQVIEPSETNTVEQSMFGSNGQIAINRVVGPSGQITLEVIFYKDLSKVHGTFHLTLNEIAVTPAQDTSTTQAYQAHWVSGSWNFTFSL